MTQNINFDTSQKDKALVKFTLNKETIKILYQRYKKFLWPLIVIVICVFLLLKVVGSQIQDFFTLREETVMVEKKINILKNNLNFLSSIDEETQNRQLQVASKALPPYKDFAGILNAIMNATIKAGVGLSDFSFSVGDVSTASATLAKSPTLTIELTIINSSSIQTKQFLTELSQVLPLTNIEAVEAGGNSANVTVLFYYKPFPPMRFNYDAPMKDLTAQEKKLLEKIANWQADYSSLDLEFLSQSITGTSSSEMSVSSQKGESESIPFAAQ